jgi:hypothetical protein
MTVEMIEERYGRHHPDFQDEAASAFGGQRQSQRFGADENGDRTPQ